MLKQIRFQTSDYFSSSSPSPQLAAAAMEIFEGQSGSLRPSQEDF